MANLTQTDYDGASGHAQQIANKKRTAGANSGKTIREVEWTRGCYKSTVIAGVLTPDANVRYIFTDGTSELLTFDGNTDLYPPGQGATFAP
jgi:hypothetical protein